MVWNNRDFTSNKTEMTGQTLASAPGFSLSGAFADKMDALAEDKATREAVNERSRIQENEELLGMQSGARESVMLRGEALERHNKEVRDRAASNQKKDDTFMFLALLDQLDAQIAALQEEIDGYDRQLEALNELRTLVASGDYDPTDPAHRKLLIAAGYDDPDDWGTVTVEDIDARIEDARRKKDAAEQQLGKAREAKAAGNEIEMEALQGTFVTKDVRNIGLDREIAEKQKEDPSFDPQHADVEDLQDLTKRSRINYLIDRHPAIEKGAEWFKMVKEDLAVDLNKGVLDKAGYIEGLNRIIDGLNEDTKAGLLKDSNTETHIKEMLRLDNFEEAYEDFQQLRDDPRYKEWLSDLIMNKTEASTRQALAMSSSTPDEVREIIVENTKSERQILPETTTGLS